MAITSKSMDSAPADTIHTTHTHTTASQMKQFTEKGGRSAELATRGRI